MKFHLGLVIIFTSFQSQASDVSIYNGEEKRFLSQDRERVINVLQNMGIPYRISQENLILVPAKSQGDVKEIVAQGFRQQRPQTQYMLQPTTNQ